MTTITREEAIRIASEFDLEAEIMFLIDRGYTPEEALFFLSLI